MEENDIFNIIQNAEHIEIKDVREYSPLVLAYIGDSVYDLVIRTIVVSKGNMQVNKLHKKVSSIVKAVSQSKMMMGITDELTEEEMSVYKRGRNAKSYTKAKNAGTVDYRIATGFEALMGYLYISGESARMLELINKGLDVLEQEGDS